ncbi:hypothetical protein MMC12_002480 [Toensbergia leucococca]|nr:hypothetical protein [Toensbergia leucococca]
MTDESPKSNKHSAVDEVTPLLAASEEGPIAQGNEEPSDAHTTPDSEQDKPLPRTQIFLLCYARLVEPIAFFSIFPFINQMIWEVGDVDEADVGFYSGLIESLFSLTQMTLMISWGRAADRLGRKPVLIYSLVGVSIATALFGLSKNIWQMILFRCLAGVFAGTVVTIRTMISENSTPKTQAQAFSFFMFTGNMGIFIGPLIGGSLSNPADQYPRVFGQIHFFKNYPYALATAVTGTVAASAAIVSALFVKETLVRNKGIGTSTSPAPTSTLKIIKSPGVPNVLLIYGMVLLLAFSYTAIAPLFWFTRPELGGYGFSPLWISIFLGAAGALQAIWVLLIFPPLQHRIGTGGILRLCSYGFPLFYALSPATNLLLRQNLRLAFWIIAPLLQVLASAASMSYTAIQLALNDVSPSPTTLGTLNAIALTLATGIRAIAPIVFTSIFATGTRTQILSGYLVWLILVLLALVTIAAIRWLPKKAEGKLVETEPTN